MNTLSHSFLRWVVAKPEDNMLTNNDITKFQAIYKEEFGTNISKEEAVEHGLKLLSLMSQVYKPMTLKESVKIDLHRNSKKQDLINRLQR